MLCGGEFRNEHPFMRMDQAGHTREVTHNHELRSGDQHVAPIQPEGCVPEAEANASTSAPVATTPTSHPKAVPIRTSARVSKKVKLDFTAAAAPVQAKVAKKDEEAADKQQAQVGTPETKRGGRRNWGLWSIEDKNTFFEALNEYGKDFDGIQAHFAVKLKKKSSQEAKNKDQVRHFYYRNWHKISKFIKFSVDLQKVTQELYALINYGELRKRIGRSVLDKNMVVKLQELIYHGYTLTKVRGKTVRVKTPVCRALRKLNMMDHSNTEIPKLPPRVLVELRPLNNDAWSKVHATAQNPRARVSLPLQHRLVTLITHMQHRWSQRDSKLLEKLAPGKHEPCPNMKLRVKPCVGSRISVLSVNINDILTSTSLSLQSYEERFLANSTGEHVAGPSGKGRNCCARRGKKKDGENKKQAIKEQRDETEDKQNLELLHAKTVGKILSLQLEGDDATDGDLRSSPLHMETEEDAAIKLEAEPKKQDTKMDDHENCVLKIKAGWTIDDANTLTLGELYIMCGVDGKLTLDYCWEHVPTVVKVVPPAESSPPTPVLQGNAAQGSPNPTDVAKPAQDNSTIAAAALAATQSNPGVKNLLSKLLSLAKILPLIKDKTNCTCGHVCGKPSRGQSRQRTSKAKQQAAANAEGKNASIQAATVVVSNTLELPPGTTMAFQPSPSPAVYQQHGLHDGVFRRPLLAPSHTHPGASAAEEAFKAQLDQFRPKYCNRRGRVGRKNVVVQRMLPLLPKTAPNMLTLKMMPQTGEFRTLNSQNTNARLLSFTSVPHHVVNSTPNLVLPVMTTQPGPSLTAAKRPLPKVEKLTPVPVVPKKEESNKVPNSIVTPSPVAPPSPPSITTLLGLGTEELSLGADSTTLLDVPLANNPPNFVGLLSNEESSIPDPCSLLQSGNTTPPISPTRILRESDNQWLNSEVADFSLSSFLGHLDSSPVKTTPAPTVVAPDDTRLSQDVEAQLQCLMSESSVDYMAKFADLAAQIASDATAKK